MGVLLEYLNISLSLNCPFPYQHGPVAPWAMVELDHEHANNNSQSARLMVVKNAKITLQIVPKDLCTV